MTRSVEVPLWLLILILAFAAVTFASHFFFPSVRWFFRRRMERAVARLNQRLDRPIEPFKLARRYDMIQRLSYDPAVGRAIAEHARAEGIPENVAFEQARRYAREIVPRFSAFAYFSFGTRIAKWLSRLFYHVDLKGDLHATLDEVPPESTVIFVMNHRSNMDYVLVTWLTARSSALSYAVGEWARVWPLSALIRAMGAYFIRRKSRGALYRKVLARYVQMATENGVTQAFFPEGGLSLTGQLAPPRMGLLNYVISDQTGLQSRDVIFIPVALNYDRVLEDRLLIAAQNGESRAFRPPLWRIFRAFVLHLADRLRGRFAGFGTVAVTFGEPLRLADQASAGAPLDTEQIADILMARLADEVAVLPVPLLAWALLQEGPPEPPGPRFTAALEALKAQGVPVPAGAPDALFDEAVRLLRARDFLIGGEGGAPGATLAATPEARPILQYYARSIAHHLDAVSPALDSAAAAPDTAPHESAPRFP